MQCDPRSNGGAEGSVKDRTENDRGKKKGRQRRRMVVSRLQKKGSVLEVADREKMTVPGGGERLFSEVH